MFVASSATLLLSREANVSFHSSREMQNERKEIKTSSAKKKNCSSVTLLRPYGRVRSARGLRFGFDLL